MQQLWPLPSTDHVDVARTILHEDRIARPQRPWVVLNMVSSVDGAATDTEGLAGKLSGPADRRVFQALRATADVVLAGAGTVRAENYGPPRVPAELAALRRERGQAPLPRLAVVSASLRLDPDARLFRDAAADRRPLVLTSQAALTQEPSASLGRDLAPVADLRPAGDRAVEWGEALRILHELGTKVLLVEGGPHVNGQLIADDLVDELCLTLSPVLLSGLTSRIVAGTATMVPRAVQLERAFIDDDYLLLRYLRRRDSNHIAT